MLGMGVGYRGAEMERMSDYEWFCANCLRMADALNRHGRCPHCDSNAVDVAYRWSRPRASQESRQVVAEELVSVH
jgi:hypothetical protein